MRSFKTRKTFELMERAFSDPKEFSRTTAAQLLPHRPQSSLSSARVLQLRIVRLTKNLLVLIIILLILLRRRRCRRPRYRVLVRLLQQLGLGNAQHKKQRSIKRDSEQDMLRRRLHVIFKTMCC